MMAVMLACMLAMIGMSVFASFATFWPYKLTPSLVHYQMGLIDAEVADAFVVSLKLAANTALFGTAIVFGGAYLLRRGLFMPWELAGVLDPDLARAGLERLDPVARLNADLTGIATPAAKVSALETAWYMRNQLLRDSDWAGMAHSLEIRVPLVDVALQAAVAPLIGRSGSPTKRLMAAAARPSLPAAILDRPKTGFRVPILEWLGCRDLRGWAGTVHGAFV